MLVAPGRGEPPPAWQRDHRLGRRTDGPPDGDKPAAIDDWIATRGKQGRIAAAGGSWIKPQESLGQYVYRPGADGEPVIARGKIEEPSGMAAGAGRLYVADPTTGLIHSFDWDAMRPGPVLDTGGAALGGLAIDPADPEWLYFTDTAAGSVSRIRVD